jgi:deoxyribodipyrimidine photo-lyase
MNLVWLRNDLRLEDNPALYHATHQGDTCCVYIITPEQWRQHDDAPAKIALWRERLIAVQHELREHNIPLKLIRFTNDNESTYNNIPAALLKLANRLNADSIYFNNEYPLNEKQRDRHVSELFIYEGKQINRYDGDVVMRPGTVKTQQDATYKVFTPFSRQWHKLAGENQLAMVGKPATQNASLLSLDEDVKTQWLIEDTPYRQDLWPTETDAIHQRLHQFAAHRASNYKEMRDIPSVNGTSTLSPYLACGAISVRQCISAIRQNVEEWRSNQWITELIWREFYRHLIDSYPHLSRSENFISLVKPIPWNNDEESFLAWCEGRTGYPIVDAAMKQLVQTGWMHNRLRMVTAAFLTKLLLVDWRKGEAFFMQHLLDGDYASNNGGWQWAASTGADAAPYFRIFSPERQSERFDKEGVFIKKLLPELSSLTKKTVHTPNSEQRKSCGYIEPVVDYKWARQRALEEYATAMGKVKNKNDSPLEN